MNRFSSLKGKRHMRRMGFPVCQQADDAESGPWPSMRLPHTLLTVSRAVITAGANLVFPRRAARKRAQGSTRILPKTSISPSSLRLPTSRSPMAIISIVKASMFGRWLTKTIGAWPRYWLSNAPALS